MLLHIEGGDIYFETSEDIRTTNKPILFVLPGGPGGAHNIYKFHSLELQEHFCVVYHDPRGCGQSQNFSVESSTLTNYISDIEALRKHLNVEKISLLGTSYGSMCAIGYATQYSAHLDRLILIGGSPSFKFLETAKSNLAKNGTDEQIAVCENLWNGSFTSDEQVKEFMRVMKPMYSKNIEFLNNNTGSGQSFSYHVLNLGFGGFLQTFDCEPMLDKITCPTLILVGEDDWINDPIHLKLAAEKIPNAQLEILENCAHFVAIDRHETYIKLITEMLNEH